MRPLLRPALLLTAMLPGCAPAGGEHGSWGGAPGVDAASGPSSTAQHTSSSPAATDDAPPSTTTAPPTSTGEATTAGTVRDMGVPDFGLQQPAGCRGKIDFLFVISAVGTMQLHQAQLIASFPGFMGAIEEQLPDFDSHILVANPNPKPGWLMDDCSLCKEDCDSHGVPPLCGAQLTACDKTIGAAVTYPAGDNASDRRCELSSGLRYIVSDSQDMTQEFTCIAQVGSGGAGRTGEAMVAALQPDINDPTDAEQCNTGFLREDALLVITVIQDTYDVDSAGTVEEWIAALRAAKHGDEDAFAVLVLTTDIDVGYDQLCWPDEFAGFKNRLRLLAEGVRHGFVGSICEDSYVPFFAEHVSHLVDLCEEFVPPA